jgi:hypothetical protein
VQTPFRKPNYMFQRIATSDDRPCRGHQLVTNQFRIPDRPPTRSSLWQRDHWAGFLVWLQRESFFRHGPQNPAGGALGPPLPRVARCSGGWGSRAPPEDSRTTRPLPSPFHAFSMLTVQSQPWEFMRIPFLF